MGFSRNLFKKSSESFPFWNSALVTRHEPPVHGLLPCSLSLQICTFVFNRFHNAPPAISFFSNFCISARGCTPPNSKCIFHSTSPALSGPSTLVLCIQRSRVRRFPLFRFQLSTFDLFRSLGLLSSNAGDSTRRKELFSSPTGHQTQCRSAARENTPSVLLVSSSGGIPCRPNPGAQTYA